MKEEVLDEPVVLEEEEIVRAEELPLRFGVV
jgi:hypothetical protein